MAASAMEIAKWFDEGVKNGKRFMLVVTDTFDWEDYPVFLPEGANAREEHHKRNAEPMQRVMECYDLNMDKQRQMHERRAWHFGEEE